MATGKCIQTLLSGRLVDCTEIPEFLFETKFECSADWLSLDLWLSLALTRSLWLSLALSGSGSIWLSVLLSLALFGSLWLSLAASGSLWENAQFQILIKFLNVPNVSNFDC